MQSVQDLQLDTKVSRTQYQYILEDSSSAELAEWTPKFLQDLEERKKGFNIVQEGNYAEYPVEGNEYPEVKQQPTNESSPKQSRRQRRARAAEARRQLRKAGKPL